jgi:hypothetical protein
MQIAETLSKSGMSAGTAFMSALSDLVASKKLTRIIETGTYHGTGTTRAILDGVARHENRPVSFVSIEVNPYNYQMALSNNKGQPVTILNGLSIPKSLLPKKEQIEFNDYSDEVIVDHFPHNRAELYYKETGFEVPDKQLDKALLLTSYYPNLVVLDSAGHIGTIEFDYLMGKVKGEFYLALDDTRHVKHSKTVEKIENNPGQFQIVFETDEKFGSRIYRVNVSGSGNKESNRLSTRSDDNSGNSKT